MLSLQITLVKINLLFSAVYKCSFCVFIYKPKLLQTKELAKTPENPSILARKEGLFPWSAASLEEQKKSRNGCGPGGPRALSNTLPRSQRGVRPTTTLSSHDVGWTPYGEHHCTSARLVCSESPQVGDKVERVASAAPQSSLSAHPSAAVTPSTGKPRTLPYRPLTSTAFNRGERWREPPRCVSVARRHSTVGMLSFSAERDPSFSSVAPCLVDCYCLRVLRGASPSTPGVPGRRLRR